VISKIMLGILAIPQPHNTMLKMLNLARRDV
jgi:hypothetical protein